jgi:hypothetical protein
MLIGSQKDELFPGATTGDSIEFLSNELANAEVDLVWEASGKHAKRLLLGSPKLVTDIISWLKNN